MHDLLTFRNRELTSFAEFRALYQNAHTTMALENLVYRPALIDRRGPRAQLPSTS